MTHVHDLSPGEYEDLTRSLVECISEHAFVQTTRIERNVALQGKSTTNRVDVVWEFTVNGFRQRVIFECRRYKSTLDQQSLHSWRSVVDDVTTEEWPTTGVVVTATGYQRGAKNVAKTYGLIVLELRDPKAADLKNRLQKITVQFNFRKTVVKITGCEVVDYIVDEDIAFDAPQGTPIEIIDEAGSRQSIEPLLLAGRLTGFNEPPAPLQSVTKQFSPPVTLVLDGEPRLRTSAVTATVGEVAADPFSIEVGGREHLAWVVKDALNGESAWFMDDGKVHLAQPPSWA